jgi:hypothetical protein
MPLVPRSRSARAIGLLLCGVGAIAGAAAPATAATPPAPRPLTFGTMTWSLTNSPATFLGSVLAAGGSVTPGAAASGPGSGTNATTPVAPGSVQAFSFPVATGGTYDVATDTGTLDVIGSLTFASPQDGFPISLVDPELTLDLSGPTSTFRSEGSGVAGPIAPAADPTAGVFRLDTTKATVQRSVGQTRITGIVPTVAQRGNPFPASYDVGVGPAAPAPVFGTIDLDVQYTIPATLTRLRGRTYTFGTGPYLKPLRTGTAAATLATTPPTAEVLATGTLRRDGTATFTVPARSVLRNGTLYTLKIAGQHSTTIGLTCPGNGGRSGACVLR